MKNVIFQCIFDLFFCFFLDRKQLQVRAFGQENMIFTDHAESVTFQDIFWEDDLLHSVQNEKQYFGKIEKPYFAIIQ